ncbi:potassium channel family protein [Methylomagnum sp.]
MTKSIAFPRHPSYRFGILTLAILLMLLVRPFLDGLIGMSLLTDLFFTAIVLSGLYAARGGKYSYRVALGLAVLGFVSKAIYHLQRGEAWDMAAEVLTALFFMHTLANIAAHIRAERKVTLDVIFAAVCAYLLLGLIFAQAFYFLDGVRPGSLKAAEPLGRDLWGYLYYSYTTLTTLGYGDVVAVTKPARSLAMLEAIVGQLYLAVLVGRLVGAYSAELRGEGP